MIRSYFNREPEKLSIKKWTQLYHEAIYLKSLDAEIQTNVLTGILNKFFSGKPEEE